MSLLFIDTGALYALCDRRDPAHARAKRFYEGCERSFLTTDFVFAEAMSLLTKRLGKKTAVTFGDGVRRSVRFRIEEPSPQAREAAWKDFATLLDKDWDLVDCLSFAVMAAFGVREAFGFDRHFVQRGFLLLPEAEG